MATRKSGAKSNSLPSVKHLSHSHPLRLSKAKEEDEIICSGCELDLTGQGYKCSKSNCDYFLHKSCFQLPPQTHHKSHPDHTLTLLYSPPNDQSNFTCKACGEYGSGFAYHCSICGYDLHIGCASMPETVEREDHEHPLTLLHSSPVKEGVSLFMCDICEGTVPEGLWVYYCEECDYGTHSHLCAADEEEDQEEEECPKRVSRKGKIDPEEAVSSATSTLASMLEAQQQMSNLHLQAQMAMHEAQMRRDMRRSIIKLI